MWRCFVVIGRIVLVLVVRWLRWFRALASLPLASAFAGLYIHMYVPALVVPNESGWVADGYDNNNSSISPYPYSNAVAEQRSRQLVITRDSWLLFKSGIFC